MMGFIVYYFNFVAINFYFINKYQYHEKNLIYFFDIFEF